MPDFSLPVHPSFARGLLGAPEREESKAAGPLLARAAPEARDEQGDVSRSELFARFYVARRVKAKLDSLTRAGVVVTPEKLNNILRREVLRFKRIDPVRRGFMISGGMFLGASVVSAGVSGSVRELLREVMPGWLASGADPVIFALTGIALSAAGALLIERVNAKGRTVSYNIATPAAPEIPQELAAEYLSIYQRKQTIDGQTGDGRYTVWWGQVSLSADMPAVQAALKAALDAEKAEDAKKHVQEAARFLVTALHFQELVHYEVQPNHREVMSVYAKKLREYVAPCQDFEALKEEAKKELRCEYEFDCKEAGQEPDPEELARITARFEAYFDALFERTARYFAFRDTWSRFDD